MSSSVPAESISQSTA